MQTVDRAKAIPPASKPRAADVAYKTLENMIVKLALKPGAPVVESELIEATGLGRTPLREALLRMSTNGLILPMPRRGLVVSDIEAAEHLTLLETRRVLERLIAASAARRATPQQRKDILLCGKKMVQSSRKSDLDGYMDADRALDQVVHEACRNPSAVAAVTPLIIKCRRFWYAYQHEGDVVQGAKCHLALAEAIADGESEAAAGAADKLVDYLEAYARKIID